MDLTQESDEELYNSGTGRPVCQTTTPRITPAVTLAPTPPPPPPGRFIPYSPPARSVPPPLIRLRLPSCRFQCNANDIAVMPNNSTPDNQQQHQTQQQQQQQNHCSNVYSNPWGQSHSHSGGTHSCPTNTTNPYYLGQYNFKVCGTYNKVLPFIM